LTIVVHVITARGGEKKKIRGLRKNSIKALAAQKSKNEGINTRPSEA